MNLTIEFTDGSRESFRFQKREDAQLKAISRVEKIADTQVLVLALEGEMRLYPLCNIKCLRVSPVPAGAPAPDFAIIGATPVG